MLIGTPRHLDDGDIAQVAAAVQDLIGAGARALLIAVAEDCAPFDGWPAFLRSLQVPVFGGIFPGLVNDGRVTGGVLLVGFSAAAQICVVRNLDRDPQALDGLDERLAAFRDAQTVMLWVDGLSARIERLIDAVYDELGAGPIFFGGGAGDTRLLPSSCLFSNEGLLEGAGVIVGLPQRIKVGVCHGWEPVAGPFLASAVDGNRVLGLDFRPALDVYREVVRQLSGQTVGVDNFFEVARAFPLGVERMDGSFVVRDPVRLEGDALVCVGEMPPQSALHVLSGRKETLLQASASACRAALGGSGQPGAALVVDCLSRALHLGADHAGQAETFRSLLIGRNGAPLPVFGVLSLGEIASQGGACLEFHNKTFVLGLIPDARTS